MHTSVLCGGGFAIVRGTPHTFEGESTTVAFHGFLGSEKSRQAYPERQSPSLEHFLMQNVRWNRCSLDAHAGSRVGDEVPKATHTASSGHLFGSQLNLVQ
jgi:hypothetical protein